MGYTSIAIRDQILLKALYEEDEALHKADLILRGQMALLGIRIVLRARLREILRIYG